MRACGLIWQHRFSCVGSSGPGPTRPRPGTQSRTWAPGPRPGPGLPLGARTLISPIRGHCSFHVCRRLLFLHLSRCSLACCSPSVVAVAHLAHNPTSDVLISPVARHGRHGNTEGLVPQSFDIVFHGLKEVMALALPWLL